MQGYEGRALNQNLIPPHFVFDPNSSALMSEGYASEQETFSPPAEGRAAGQPTVEVTSGGHHGPPAALKKPLGLRDDGGVC